MHKLLFVWLILLVESGPKIKFMKKKAKSSNKIKFKWPPIKKIWQNTSEGLKKLPKYFNNNWMENNF